MSNENSPLRADNQAAPQTEDADVSERREALKRLGRLAALTSPGIVTLLLSNRAHAFSPPVDPNEFTGF